MRSEAHDRVVEKVKKDPDYFNRLREMLELTGQPRATTCLDYGFLFPPGLVARSPITSGQRRAYSTSSSNLVRPYY